MTAGDVFAIDTNPHPEGEELNPQVPTLSHFIDIYTTAIPESVRASGEFAKELTLEAYEEGATTAQILGIAVLGQAFYQANSLRSYLTHAAVDETLEKQYGEGAEELVTAVDVVIESVAHAVGTMLRDINPQAGEELLAVGERMRNDAASQYELYRKMRAAQMGQAQPPRKPTGLVGPDGRPVEPVN